MKIQGLCLAVALITALASATVAPAADIVTVPTANQLKQGNVELNYFHIELDAPRSMPQAIRAQTLCVGLTDAIELDAHRYDVDKVGDDTIWNATYKLMDESLLTPDLVVGVRDVTADMAGASYFVSAAKTLNPSGAGADMLPVIRGHLSLGTSDDTLLDEERHEGFFGGVQVTLRADPEVGFFALHDGRDLITGGSFTPGPRLPTLKGGTFGDHWWVGLSYTISPPG